MRRTSYAVNEIHKIEELADKDQWLNRIHPLIKLCITIYYITLIVSFPKYNLPGLLSMTVYIFVLCISGKISMIDSLHRVRFILPVVCVTGILNPLFDRIPVYQTGSFIVTGGILSMLTLCVKGVLTVFGAYLLIATTSLPKICAALRILHTPKLIVTVILLIYRYLILFINEIEHTTQAYALRAPGQKGIQFRAWGSFAGLILLRTIDRAQNVYESMCLRGFQGEFYYGETGGLRIRDILYFIGWACILTFLRIFPMMSFGNILIGSV